MLLAIAGEEVGGRRSLPAQEGGEREQVAFAERIAVAAEGRGRDGGETVRLRQHESDHPAEVLSPAEAAAAGQGGRGVG